MDDGASSGLRDLLGADRVDDLEGLLSDTRLTLRYFHLFHRPHDSDDQENFVEAVAACQNEDGGFGGNKTHDSHLLYTLSGVQVLLMLDAIDRVDTSKIVDCCDPPIFHAYSI